MSPVRATRLSTATLSRTVNVPMLASSQKSSRVIIAQASARDVSIDAAKGAVKGESSRLTIRKVDLVCV